MGFSCWSFSSICILSIIQFLCCSLPIYAITRNNETDRLALLEFKAKITDDPFGMMSSWNSSVHFCQWYGVKCGRRHQRVTVLDLSSLKLSGSISPHVGNLSFLRRFVIHNNIFSHEIPPQIGHLRRLQMLAFSNNSLGSQIPPTISNCSNLVFFYLNGNNLVGEIPVWIDSLEKLKYIYFSHNNLTGTLRPSLGNLSSLEKLSVNQNQLQGNLPHTLGQLKNLEVLTIRENQFSGTILSSIFNLSSIEVIDAAFNHLQGNLSLVDLGISVLPNLYFFSISSNQFYDTIPTSISNASNLQILQLALNNFTGAFPSFEKLHKLVYLNIQANHLGSAGKANGDLKFLSTLTNATALVRIEIGNNNFGGQLPEKISNLSKKLQIFSVQANQIFGSIPAGIFSLESLQAFFAGSNKFSATIPSTIGKLQNLQILSLELNKFLGGIPSSLGNLTNLFIIDLSDNNLQGMIPSSLANCNKLTQIDLGRNNLSGPIPQKLFELSWLSIYFGVSENRLSGLLPNEVGNLKNLQALDLSGNMLSGKIPSTLGSCTSLQLLYIDYNKFQGSIPSSLSSLRGITELYVSHNNFSGKIPEFLKSFTSINILDLSYNDFEGMVPIEGVFRNATATSVAGNKNLCGGIPAFRLPACKFQQSKRRLTTKLKIIISAIAVSVLVGVALVLIALFLCHSRKRKGQSTLTSLGQALLNCSYQSLLKATSGFSSDNLIGIGSFGSVYKGILDKEGIVIAVKVLNLQNRGASKSFIAECAALRNIRHRNLVKILTACSGIDYHGNDFKALVYEFMSNGNLDGWLHPMLGSDEERRTLNVQQRLNIAIDVACALEYLHHHCETPIVHCDLKPSNVLLDEEMIGHVSDFGLVKFLSGGTIDYHMNQSSSIGVRGTIGYCPPEYGMGNEVSTSSDIFSFGILLLEMFTGKKPTDDIFKEGLSLHNFVKRVLPGEVIEVIDPNLLQMQFNEDATSTHGHNFRNRRNNKLLESFIPIFEIGISCSVESPQQRMNIGDVTAQLSSIRNKLLITQLPREREVGSAIPL